MVGVCALLAAGLLAAAGTESSPSLPPAEATWRAVEVPGFVVVGPLDERSLQEVARRMATLRVVLSKLGTGLDLGGERPIPVYVFTAAEEFAKYAPSGKGSKDLGGYFATAYGYRAIAINFSSTAPFGTVYHELVHHVVHRNFGKVPTWFDEGIAGLYETFECGSESVTIGRLSKRRLAWFENHPLMPMRSLAEVTTDSSDYNESERAGTFYLQSLIAIHDLYFGRSPRAAQLPKYLEAVHAGVSPVAALDAFDGGAEGIGQEISGYLKAGQFPYVTMTFEQLKVPEAGRARILPRQELLDSLGALALLASPREPELAAAHFRASLAMESGRPRALAGLAVAAYASGDFATARAAADSSIAAGNDDPGIYLIGARAILRVEERAHGETVNLDTPPSADVLKARGWLQKAITSDPSDGTALISFGQTFLFGGGDPSPGIAALERADSLDRLDEHALSSLLELRVRQGDRARAEALVENRLRPIASPAVMTEAIEALLRLDVEDANEAIRSKDYRRALALLRGVRDKTTNPGLKALVAERMSRLEAAASRQR